MNSSPTPALFPIPVSTPTGWGRPVGGPIIRNKLFYFGDYEYNPTGQSTTPGQIYTPTKAGYATLASIPNLNQTNLGVLKQYAAPATTPIAASQFPVVAGVPIEAGVLTVVAPNYTNSYAAVASVDYNFSDADQARVRYVYNKLVNLDHAAELPVFYQIQPTDYDLATISEYHDFSPTLVNELRLGFNRYLIDTPAGNFKFPGLDAFPNLSFGDLNGLQLGPNPNAPQSAAQSTYQLNDNVTWTRGKHTLQFGFDGRRAIAPIVFSQAERGNYQYSTLDLFLRDITPDEVAQRTLGNPTYYGNDWRLYGYANDAWRFRPNLTINLGLRYEYTSVPYTDNLQNLNAISNVPGVLVFAAPKAQTKNFAPRVGIAYSPGRNGTTSIRAGFGMAYDVIYDNIGVLAVPPQFSTFIDETGAGAPNFLASGGIVPTTQGGTLTAAEARAQTSAYIPNQKLPYSVQWNLGVQHVFARDYTFEARYLGTRGVHLDVQIRPLDFSPVTRTNSLPTFLQPPSEATLNALPLTLQQLKVPPVLPKFAAARIYQRIADRRRTHRKLDLPRSGAPVKQAVLTGSSVHRRIHVEPSDRRQYGGFFHYSTDAAPPRGFSEPASGPVVFRARSPAAAHLRGGL